MMTHATVGYTMRRLRISPIKAYLTIVVYYLAIIIIFWAVTIASIAIIGKIGLTLSGVTTINTQLALGFLRTEIGHALIPFSHPLVIAFNITVILALATECARSCYLSWHNGRQSASIAIIVIPMAIVWTCNLEGIYLLACITVVFFYMVTFFPENTVQKAIRSWSISTSESWIWIAQSLMIMFFLNQTV